MPHRPGPTIIPACGLHFASNRAVSEALALAQFADIAHQRVNGIVVQSVSPAGHAGRASNRPPALLNGGEQMFVGAGFQIIRLGVIAWRNGQMRCVDAVAMSIGAMTLGAVKLVRLAGFLSDWMRARGW